jgi:membrane protein YdbS with pleckstrin-like domain
MTQPADPGRPQQTPPTAPPPPGGIGSQAMDKEVVYFEGRPMLRADQAKAFLWLLVGLVLIGLPILASVFDWTWWSWWMTLISVLVALIVVVVPWLLIRATRYRVTNYRIDFERGILTKRIDTLELWHVDDIRFEQGLVDRMMNVGSITITSDDKSTPRLELHGIPNPRQIFDQLKERVIAVKRQRGVIKMDMGS